MKVCLDPGHDRSNPGAVGPTGLQEADVTLRLCRVIREKLQEYGHESILTHDGDDSLPEDELTNWKARASRANATLSDVYVSVHCRTAEDDNLGGSAVYWPKGNAFSALLAQRMYERLSAMEGGNILGIFSVESLYETRKAHMPAVLLEAATITNRTDEALLQDNDWIEQFSDSIALALGTWNEQATKIMTPREVSLTRQGHSDAAESQTAEEAEPTDDNTTSTPDEQPSTEEAVSAITVDTPAATSQQTSDTGVITRAPANVWVTPVMQVMPGRAATPRMPRNASAISPRSHRVAAAPSANVPTASAQQPSVTSPASPTPTQAPGVAPAAGVINPSGTKKQMLQGIKVSTVVQTPQGRVPVPGNSGSSQSPSTPK